MGAWRLSRIAAVGDADVIDRDRQQYDRSHADPPGEWPFLRLPSLRQRLWVAVALPAALHGTLDNGDPAVF
jgi:hypothetical protein